MNKRDARITANNLRRAGWPNIEIIKYERTWRVYADNKAFDSREQAEDRIGK